MFVQTPEQEEKSELAYENSYIKEEPKASDTDGIKVTPKKEPVRNSGAVKYFQSTADVNFRLTPDIKRIDNIIGVLKKGLKVSQVDDTVTDGFLHVEYEHKRGYIKQNYLKEV